jgi:hypothetical protein
LVSLPVVWVRRPRKPVVRVSGAASPPQVPVLVRRSLVVWILARLRLPVVYPASRQV